MTALASDVRAVARDTAGHRLSFPRVLRSEAIKVVSLRSTWWSLGVAALLSIGITLMIASASAGFPPGYDAVNAILAPTQFTMLVAGILGAIVVTGEYSTGMIRSSFTAEPRRGAVLLAKATVAALLIAITTAVIYAVAIVASAPLLETGIDWSEPATSVVPLAWGVASMAVFTLIGVGFGFIVRNGAGAIAATVGVLFVLPIVFSLFGIAGESWQWVVDLGRFLPMNAAAELSTTGGRGNTVESALTLAAWAVGPLLIGWAMVRTRDA